MVVAVVADIVVSLVLVEVVAQAVVAVDEDTNKYRFVGIAVNAGIAAKVSQNLAEMPGVE